MRAVPAELDGVLCIEPRILTDRRGYFFESWSRRVCEEAGVVGDFVQDNVSYSRRGVLRGLHIQHPRGQAKLVQAVQGRVFDVAVDLRPDSKNFAKWVGVELSEENHRQVYIPAGFAHGFCVLSEAALVVYKCSDYYAPESEFGVHYADPQIGVDWPIDEPIVSERDAKLPHLRDIPQARLPTL